MAKLFDFVLTPAVTGADGLYYRQGTDGITFDTYFHGISVRKLKCYTTIRELHVSGHVDFYTEQGMLKSGESIRMDEIPDAAEWLYVRTSKMPEQLSAHAVGEEQNVHLAVIICTFHRVTQVRETISCLLSAADSLPLEIILVDNASEIPGDTWQDDRVTVLHNVNSGGSGGFSRGMQYAAEQGAFTHLLLMDDDVKIDCISIQKLIGFLTFRKKEYADLCVAGSMLCADDPTIQFECGGYFSPDGMQDGHGYRFDLTDPRKLLENEQDRPINYGGWWMFCMPVRYAAEGNLPAPFFLKYDDVEYALRCRLQIITLNGVGVWHEAFGSKYNSVQEYFDTRNYLFLRKRHSTSFDDKAAYKAARYRLLEKVCRQQYQMAEAVLLAYTDFRKGEAYLEQIRYPEKLAELQQLNYQLLTDEQICAQYGIRFDEALYRACCTRQFRRYMQPLLYGHLIPRMFCRKLTITDVLADRKEHYFGAAEVLHYSCVQHTGYVTEKSLLRLISFLRRLRKIAKGRNDQ